MIVYCARNKINGKLYIGQTRHSLMARWRGHVAEARNCHTPRYFCKAIRKYGPEAFELCIIAEATSQDALDILEEAVINCLHTCDARIGYNRKEGGVMCAESIAQMAAKKRGRPMSPEQREKIRRACTGKRWSDEARARWMGHKKSPETIVKMIAAQNSRFDGHRHSEETKAKMRKPHRLTPKLVAHLSRLNAARRLACQQPQICS